MTFRFPTLLLAASFALGCASERAPINRVQPNALDKTFFVGASLSSDDDDPEFYYRPTVVDADYGAQRSGLFTASYAQTTARIRWEVTEELLLARLTYERIDDSTGNGVDETDSGQITAAFRIESHFDVRRDYNPQTGEELNVLDENATDRPWYERKFMRVDWSQNLITTAYELDTLDALRVYTDEPMLYEPVAYSVEDPENPDAPAFDADRGYFDVTNKVFVTPQLIDTPWGKLPACWLSPDFLSGGAPVANCNPAEIKVRLSFRQVVDEDYQPTDWDGTRMDMFGLFTQERRGYDRHYDLVDDKWHRFAARHNIWQESHARVDGEFVPCNYVDPKTGAGTPTGADPDRDSSPANGTADECEEVGRGSRCDRFTHACTLPFRDRETRPVPFYYGPESDPTLWESVALAVGEWDGALRHSVQTARYTECIRSSQGSVAPTRDEIDACKRRYPPTLEGALEAVPRIMSFCHNPVESEDDPSCGEAGLAVRVGDLRYNMANVVQNPQTPSPWGILADAVDPLTGQVVAASVNIWNAVTDTAAQSAVDRMRWYLGELSNDDVSSGRSLNDYLGNQQRKPLAAREFPLIPETQVLARLAGLDRSLVPERLLDAVPKLDQRELVDWASASVRSTFGASVLGSGNAGQQTRLAQARSSAVELGLMTAPYARLAGLDPSLPLSGSMLDLASPLRGSAVEFKSQLDHLRDLKFAEQGRCMLEGPDPTSIGELAKIMAEKFPLEGNSSADVLARNKKWFDFVRRKLTYGVLLHEFGHSMGLRHVFSGSFDALNFRTQYWQLRTRDGKETKYCTDATDDGASCVGPRWRDPLTDQERDGMIWTWEQGTVMDYPGDLTQDMIGIGSYDRAAIRFAYGDVADVIDDPAISCPSNAAGTARTCTEAGAIAESLSDSTFGGLAGPWYGATSQNPAGAPVHYSQLGQKMGLARNCRAADTSPPPGWDEGRDGVYSAVFDGQIVNGTVCDGMPVDYVAYSELQLDQPGFQQQFGAFGGPVRKYDALGRVRHPYMFGSDEYVRGNLPVQQHDNGADAYEVASYLINAYELDHIWQSYRRSRSTFSLKNQFMRGFNRYNVKLMEIAKGFGLYNEIFGGTGIIDLVTTGAEADGYLKSNAITASLIFDHFTRILTRPSSGAHFLDSTYDPNGAQVFRSNDQQLAINDPSGTVSPTLSVPDGAVVTGQDLWFGGRPLNNAFDRNKGYYTTDYDAFVGSYYDKTLALYMMTDSSDRFVDQSRDDFVDGRYRNVSFATMFPEGIRRLLAAAVTEDQAGLGWRVESKNGRPVMNGGGEPQLSMGVRSFWPNDQSEVCWRRSGSLLCREFPSDLAVDDAAPSESLAVDPEIGFEVQKFAIFWAMLNLPDGWKGKWVDRLRVFNLGPETSPLFPPEEQAIWVDPASGETYVAHREGYEEIDGKQVDRGIAARAIDWANLLTEQAYQVDGIDPETNAFIYAKYPDDSACPERIAHCKGLPIVRSQRFVARVEGYKSLIDYMYQLTSSFGFDSPGWRGVY